MSRPVPGTPPLPYPVGFSLGDLAAFDQDLVKALFTYLTDLARRANESLPSDGQEPMTGNLNLGGFSILNVDALTMDGPLRLETNDVNAIVLQDIGATGNTVATGIRIEDSAGTRKHFIGDASSSDSNLYLISDAGNITLTPAGNVVVLSNGQLAFPVTQVPSADPNTLDDYEEGTWTPSYVPATGAFGSITYGVQAGTYTKIGNQVTIHWRITTSAATIGTAAGQLRIAGMPFTNAAVAFSGTLGYTAGWTAKPGKYILSGGLILLYGSDDSLQDITEMNLASTNEIRGTLTYHV